ncbi:Oidioi.mRNA.OKI2018_I69.chr1.g2209.t1.cds [Oikopleura dioica]|uniref:Oidioi.mRNA.OKI2018_I69.chr1.g2209.t1.cds n=1 Tax=Oikopleura dioica TaxID=34765 RepID=A0ABN7SUA2_OIKDI|nr:Oidioi.mRNA.OKI2018_I69.chr1.g2209.t1.cds [Oikopleura dioica]
MATRENYRHLKNFCGDNCEISNILLQKNSATFFDIQGKQNVITITPVGEDFTGDLELFTAFYHIESVILCGRLDDSTRCYRINKALDPDSLERFEGLEPLIFPFSDFVIKSDDGKVLLLEKDIYGFNMFLAENNSILWKNSFSVGDQVLATYESARNHASYIISSDKNEGMITNYCQNDAGINKTPPEENLMCSSCVSYKLSCCSKHSGLCSSEILSTTKHEDAIYSVFKFGKNSRLCKTSLEKIDEEFLSQNQRYCYSTSCDTMSPSPKEMGKTIKIAESICEDSDIVFADCSAPQVRLFSREYMTLVNSGLKTDKTLFMEEVGALVGTPSSLVISTDDAGAKIVSLLENNVVRRGYLRSDGLTMVDDKSFDENIVLIEEVASGLAFNVEEQELISLEECHLPKETSCLKCQEGIGCQWSDGECRTVSSIVENQTCPALGLLDFLESKNFYKGERPRPSSLMK